MSIAQLILLCAIGLIAGAFSGTFGVGGAIIVIPSLVFLLGMSQHQAQGTSLAFMIPPVTLLAALSYWKSGYVNWKYAVVLSITFIIGSFFGSQLSFAVSDSTLRKFFGVVLLLISLKIIFSK
jgi:uncharacterized membrane protein YfcA